MEDSKTWLYITVKVLRMLSRGNTWKPFKCDRDPIFRLQIWTEISHSSEIHYQPDPTERNGSLDMWQPEMWRTYLSQVCFDRKEKSNLKKQGFHQIVKLEILSLKSP